MEKGETQEMREKRRREGIKGKEKERRKEKRKKERMKGRKERKKGKKRKKKGRGMVGHVAGGGRRWPETARSGRRWVAKAPSPSKVKMGKKVMVIMGFLVKKEKKKEERVVEKSCLILIKWRRRWGETVSYTHLTLPTIYSV